ncbi:hypothetical protein BU17DRAFT_39094 [Hysterangium stoloniferum]|nr:hypothetical protein BU17DRAFT_39094 [Hysterangium stoloniferum]
MFSLALLAIAVPLIVSAQTVHDVQVGDINGSTVYSPEAIVGIFSCLISVCSSNKNHTVTQSSFADPCGPEGFDSGYMPVAPGQTTDLPQYNITVMDEKPIWIHCAQKNPKSHCGLGMVFAVNCGAAGSANSFDAFKAAAIAQGSAEGASSPAASPSPTPTDPAAAGSGTIPPDPVISTVTQAITLEGSTWTTTYGSYPGSAAPTPASLTGNVINVAVGNNGTLTFNPSRVSAQPRDTIVFTFMTKNHTVTQSTFSNPCVQLNNATTSQVGFDSGFQFVAPDSTQFPTFNYTVVDTSPVWAYCRQKTPSSHCANGMVFAINSVETSDHSFNAFSSLAKATNAAAAGSNGTASNTTTSVPAAATNPASSGVRRSTAVGTTFGLVAIIGGLMTLF